MIVISHDLVEGNFQFFLYIRVSPKNISFSKIDIIIKIMGVSVAVFDGSSKHGPTDYELLMLIFHNKGTK